MCVCLSVHTTHLVLIVNICPQLFADIIAEDPHRMVEVFHGVCDEVRRNATEQRVDQREQDLAQLKGWAKVLQVGCHGNSSGWGRWVGCEGAHEWLHTCFTCCLHVVAYVCVCV